MFNLPDRALFGKRIPKAKFYEKMNKGSKLKDKFAQEIDYIVWKYKISKDTINIEPSEGIEEIQIFEVYLKQKSISKDVIESMDKVVPYPILFVLIYDDDAKLSIAYKQRNKNDENKFVINSYYESEWLPIQDMSMDLVVGLNLWDVYENMIKAMMDGKTEPDISIEEAALKQKKIDKLKLQISRLESGIQREKQFNKKVPLNMELQRKRQELEELIL